MFADKHDKWELAMPNRVSSKFESVCFVHKYLVNIMNFLKHYEIVFAEGLHFLSVLRDVYATKRRIAICTVCVYKNIYLTIL